MDTINLGKYQEKLHHRRKQVLSTLRHLEQENREVGGQRHFDWLDQARDESESQLLQRLSDGYLFEASRTWHILNDDRGIARNVLSYVPRYSTGVNIKAASWREAHNETDGLPLIEGLLSGNLEDASERN